MTSGLPGVPEVFPEEGEEFRNVSFGEGLPGSSGVFREELPSGLPGIPSPFRGEYQGRGDGKTDEREDLLENVGAGSVLGNAGGADSREDFGLLRKPEFRRQELSDFAVDLCDHSTLPKPASAEQPRDQSGQPIPAWACRPGLLTESYFHKLHAGRRQAAEMRAYVAKHGADWSRTTRAWWEMGAEAAEQPFHGAQPGDPCTDPVCALHVALKPAERREAVAAWLAQRSEFA